MKFGTLRLNRWIILFIVFPTVTTAIYFGLIASNQYVSESRFVVKSQSDRPSQLTNIASLIQTTGLSSGQEQTNEILDYIRSRNALDDLTKGLNVEAMYGHPGLDWFSRYSPVWNSDKFERFYQYYSGKIDTRLDAQTGLAVLEVRAFSPDDAKRINSLLLDQSEALINRLNVKAHDNAIAEAERRVEAAQTRTRAARLALAGYRNANDLLDPLKQATGVLDISNKLVAEKATLEAQLDVMQSVTPKNPAIPAMLSRVAAIQQQIDRQNGKAVGTKGAISSKLASYENLQLEQEFASQSLAAANLSLEQARTEADRQQFYLERVVEPNKPDLALLPHRIRAIATVFVASICLYVIGWMLIVGILEHAPEE